MTTNKRTRSISRKINSRSVSRQLRSFLLINIIIIAFACLMWCVKTEYDGSGSFKSGSSRYFTSIDILQNEYPDIKSSEAYDDYKSAKKFNAGFSLPGRFSEEKLAKVFYVYEDEAHNTQYAYFGSFLIMLASGIAILIILQIIIMIPAVIRGAKKTRSDLAPLDELAFKAEMLARASSFDQQSLDELEEAINRLSPSGDGISIHTDNAELVELEAAINGLLERTRENYRQQSRFVSDASHELRTPISVLQGYVNMLDRWGKTDEQILDESIDAIKSETEHMKKLVEQLLFLARGDSGKTKLCMETFSLNEMIKEVYDESQMIDGNHQYRYLPSGEDIIITADPSMLKQTARILIDNAAKYAPDGSEITIKTSSGSAGSNNGGHSALPPAFIVQDEGIGMSGGDVPHIFKRFYRSDPARSKDSGGTGLGLSIAKWIIDRHGGYFDVLSRENIGTRITVYLPQKRS